MIFFVGKINDRNCKVALNYKVQYRYRYLIYSTKIFFILTVFTRTLVRVRVPCIQKNN